MASETKRALRANVRALLVKLTGELRAHETGVSRLVALGIAQGTSQRILDDTDIRLSTIDEAAAKLGVSPGALLSGDAAEASALPFRDLDPLEVQLVTYFRQMEDDERRELLVLMSQRQAPAPTPSTEKPRADTGRRIQDVGHVPDRRRLKIVRR
jgi:hypothetical protein